MAMENSKLPPLSETNGTIRSRRHALALMLGAGQWLPKALAANPESPIRLAISESLVADVNMNDARAAMVTWITRMTREVNVVIEYNPKVFDTTEEIVRRARAGQVDSIALNVVEYRQIADVLDSNQIIAEGSSTGLEQYVLLVKRDSKLQQLSDLRGRRLIALKAPKMCVAPAWLATILDEGHLGKSEQFFGSVTTETKVSRVVLPVFFGQTDACLANKRGFDTICELNPQVAKELTVIASSPAMVVTFYVFHKNYHGASREKFAKVYADIPASPAGRQLAMLFQFERLIIQNADSLAPALAVLESAERVRNRPAGVGQRDRK